MSHVRVQVSPCAVYPLSLLFTKSLQLLLLHVSSFGDGSRGGSGGGGVPDSILLGEAVVDEEDDGGGGGGFDQARELIMGTLAASMAKGVKQWEQKGPEQRDAAVRWVGTCAESCRDVAEGVSVSFRPTEGRPKVLLIVLYGPAAVFRHRRDGKFQVSNADVGYVSM